MIAVSYLIALSLSDLETKIALTKQLESPSFGEISEMAYQWALSGARETEWAMPFYVSSRKDCRSWYWGFVRQGANIRPTILLRESAQSRIYVIFIAIRLAMGRTRVGYRAPGFSASGAGNVAQFRTVLITCPNIYVELFHDAKLRTVPLINNTVSVYLITKEIV